MAKDRTKDLTQGTPWKVIAGFSLPVIGGNLFQLFYTLADSMIVGRTLGADALAAVGATATIVYFVLCFIQGLTGGCGILLGQAFGAGNEKQVRESVSASVWISALFTIVLTVLCCSMVHPILRMLNTPVDIYDRTYTYLFIIFLGNGATVFYNMISNILRALGDSRTPLYFLIFSSLLNVVLDVVFIVPFGMDVAGAAWATVLAQAISAALCIVFALKRFPILHLSAREGRFSAEAAWLHLRIGIANFVARYFGAGKLDRIIKGVWHCFLMLSAMNFAMGALLLLGQSFVVPMFVTNPTAEIMQYSKDYLFTVVPFYFFLGALLVYRTAIQSVGNTWAPFAACVIELAARILCASVLSVPFGYRAVCFATPFAWLTALSLLIPVYIVLIRKLDGGQSTQTKT